MLLDGCRRLNWLELSSGSGPLWLVALGTLEAEGSLASYVARAEWAVGAHHRATGGTPIAVTPCCTTRADLTTEEGPGHMPSSIARSHPAGPTILPSCGRRGREGVAVRPLSAR